MFLGNPIHIPVVCNGWGGVNMLGIRFHGVWSRPWNTTIIKPLELHNNNEGTAVRLSPSKWLRISYRRVNGPTQGDVSDIVCGFETSRRYAWRSKETGRRSVGGKNVRGEMGQLTSSN